MSTARSYYLDRGVEAHTASAAKWARMKLPQFESELKEFISFPSISSQPEHFADLQNNAEWLTSHLRQIGMENCGVFKMSQHPVVYADWRRAAGRPTVLIYGHYDVHPAEPMDAWRMPPFSATVHGDNLYGRGASDNKGQMFAHIKALESYLKTSGSLPVNVICLFDGAEEIGSPKLGSLLKKYKSQLCADVAVISDMAIPAPDRPAITYSLRGAVSLELEVLGPRSGLHSGIFGGAVHNPVQVLCEIVAKLHDPNGRVMIPGFYDRVQPLSARERAYMQRVGPADAELVRDAGVSEPWGEPGYSLYERTTIRPALTINGLSGGYTGKGPNAVVPARAAAKFNFRLVPDQKPEEIEHLFRQHIARISPPTITWKLHTQALAKPVTMDRSHPAIQAALSAYSNGFGAMPVFLRSGGTIPVANLLQEELGIPVVLMGFGLPDGHIHAPNEKFHLPTFLKGIRTSIHFLAEMGALEGRLSAHKNIC